MPQSESENGTRIRAELAELRRMQVAQQAETDKKLKELSKVKKEVEVLRWVTKGGVDGQRCAPPPLRGFERLDGICIQ